MSRFQLIFRAANGEYTELRFSSPPGHPHIAGQPLTDGGTVEHDGIRWVVRRQDNGNLTQFICTPQELASA